MKANRATGQQLAPSELLSQSNDLLWCGAAPFECLELALIRSANEARKGLLLGVGRTQGGHRPTDASDPKRTWRERLLDHSISPSSFQPTTIRLAEIVPVSGSL